MHINLNVDFKKNILSGYVNLVVRKIKASASDVVSIIYLIIIFMKYNMYKIRFKYKMSIKLVQLFKTVF